MVVRQCLTPNTKARRFASACSLVSLSADTGDLNPLWLFSFWRTCVIPFSREKTKAGTDGLTPVLPRASEEARQSRVLAARSVPAESPAGACWAKSEPENE